MLVNIRAYGSLCIVIVFFLFPFIGHGNATMQLHGGFHVIIQYDVILT